MADILSYSIPIAECHRDGRLRDRGLEADRPAVRRLPSGILQPLLGLLPVAALRGDKVVPFQPVGLRGHDRRLEVRRRGEADMVRHRRGPGRAIEGKRARQLGERRAVIHLRDVENDCILRIGEIGLHDPRGIRTPGPLQPSADTRHRMSVGVEDLRLIAAVAECPRSIDLAAHVSGDQLAVHKDIVGADVVVVVVLGVVSALAAEREARAAEKAARDAEREEERKRKEEERADMAPYIVGSID